MSLQKTYHFDKFQKTGFSHQKRYSDADFRTNKIDKLLITQTSLFSQPKIKILKTKLPLIATFNTMASSQGNSHSYGKVSRMADSMNQLQNDFGSLKEGLQDLKVNLERQKDTLSDRLNQVKESLSNKTQRLTEMVQFSISESGLRSTRLMEDCDRLKQSSVQISQQISLMKERMRHLQNSMGIYTGEDKYLV